MGTIFRKAWTAPLPPNAEVVDSGGQRIARWRLRNGKLRTAEVIDGRDGSLRIRGRTAAYIAKYRDHDGVWVEHSTGCKDETAARAILGKLERQAELILAGVMTEAEAEVARFGNQAIEVHIEAWKEHLRMKGSASHWYIQAQRRVLRVCKDRAIRRLSNFRADALERWLREQADQGMSAGTRNGYRRSCVAFCNWCAATNRLVRNPLGNVTVADERAGRTRTRRAFTEDELNRLLDAARRRPLVEAMTVRRGKDRGKLTAKVRPAIRERLERTGWERALIYKTLVLTGLRKGELASITVSQVDFGGAVPHFILDAKDEKNRKGSDIPMRTDLAAEIRAWLDDRLAVLQAQAGRRGDPIPAQLPPGMRVFDVPSGLIRIFDKDLVFAGIAHLEERDGKEIVVKTDDRGRTVDVHSLRMTFGTYLSKGGVPLRTAQAAMRHSDPSLTANVYTDPRLLDVVGALEALPRLGHGPVTVGDAERDLSAAMP